MDEPGSFIERAKKRKLVQWALAYAAGAWLVLQLLSLLAQPFAWPDLVLRASVVVLAVGFVTVLVLAWFHGEKGQQRASGVELVMLAALLVVAAAGVALVSRRDKPAREPDAEAVADPSGAPSIAVLPFVNSSSVAENQYFADGITEEILTNLSKVTGVRVISWTSVMKYRDTELGIPEIAGELSVTHVLEGRVQRVGDQVRIHAQLIRARDDRHLWARQYDRGVADIFAVQSEIATAIASELKPHLSATEGQRLAARPTDNFEAYDLFLRAREHYSLIDVVGADSAAPLLRRALELDPDFVSASALLARSYSLLSRRDLAFRDSAVKTARAAVSKAPDNADAHSALGESLREQGLYDEARKSYARALELQPNHALSVGEMGELLGPYGMGRLDEAMLWLERGIELDPAAGWVYVLLGDSWQQLGDYDRARDAYVRMQRMDPDYYAGMTWQLGLAVEMNDTATMRATIDRIRTYRPDVSLPPLMSSYHASAGDSAGAARWASQISDSVMRAQPPLGRMTRKWYRGDRAGARREAAAAEQQIRALQRGDRIAGDQTSLALIAIVRGDRTAALAHLEKYFAKGGRDGALLRKHIMFASLQSEPRMRTVLDRIRTDIAAQRARIEARNGQRSALVNRD